MNLINFFREYKIPLRLISLLLLLAAIPLLLLINNQKNLSYKGKAAENKSIGLVSNNPVKPEFKKGEILVKFKQQLKPQLKPGIVGALDIDKQDIPYDKVDEKSLPRALINLNKQYKVKSLNKVFKGVGTPDQELKKIQSLDSKSSRVKRQINEREFLKIDLSRTYKISIDENELVEQAVKDLSQNPDVEYAEPNYIVKINDPVINPSTSISTQIMPSNDACAYEKYPNNFFPYCLGTWYNVYDKREYGYLLFKLKDSQGQSLLPSENEILDANLDLTVAAGFITKGKALIQIYEGLGDFNEQSINWNNKPVLGNLLISKEIQVISNQHFQFNIKDFIKNNISANKDTLTLIIKLDESNDGSIQFYDKDSYGDKKPKLIILSQIEPTPTLTTTLTPVPTLTPIPTPTIEDTLTPTSIPTLNPSPTLSPTPISSLADDPYYLDSYPINVSNRDPSWNPQYDYQWNLKKIHLEEAWRMKTNPSKVRVAIIDTGVDYTHPEFGGCSLDQVNNNQCTKVTAGYDFVNNDNDPMDDHGHGTHVAGTIVALTNNSLGIASIADNAELIPFKGLSNDGIGSSDVLANTIRYAVQKNADIINMSWGGAGISSTIVEALQFAFDLDVVLIAAAGNNDTDASSYYPAGDPNVLAVAATDINDKRADFSNYGLTVGVSAPGVDILSLRASNTDMYCPNSCNTQIIGEKYYRANGTSMAAPHVSGLAALIKGKKSSFTNGEIYQIIKNGADPISPDKYIGTGRINALKSLQIDTVPIAKIISPNFTDVYGNIDIKGTAAGSNFSHYILEIGKGWNPDTWKEIFTSFSPITNNNLMQGWKTTNEIDGVVTLKLSVYDQNNNKAESKVNLVITNQIIEKSVQGWPKKTNPLYPYNLSIYLPSPVIANIDGGSDNELIVPIYDGRIYVYKYSGQTIPGWPVNLNSSVISSSVAVGDINKDGFNEIIINNCGVYGIREGGATCVFKKDGLSLNGWPKTIGSGNERIYNTPTLVDLDNDGYLEIITGKEGPGIFAFQYDGSIVQGWPKGEYGTGLILQAAFATSAVVDVDNDSQSEVIAATFESSMAGSTGKIFALNKNGSNAQGWPWYSIPNSNIILIGGIDSSPAIGDIDNDGVKEIVFGNSGFMDCLEKTDTNCLRYNQYFGGIFVIDTNAHIKKGWPVGLPNTNHFANVISSPALGDLDNDGKLEIVVGSWNNNIYAYKSDGTLMPGHWPVKTDNTINSSPIIADVDNDSQNEIIIGSGDGYIYALEADGSFVTGWPIVTASALITNATRRGIRSTAAIGDLNNDGIAELAFTDILGNIYLINTKSKLKSEWPMFNHDEQHTGVYTSTVTQTPTKTPTPTPLRKKVCAQVITYAKNPATNECRAFNTPCDVPTGWTKVSGCPNITPGIMTKPPKRGTISTPIPTLTPTPTKIPVPTRFICNACTADISHNGYVNGQDVSSLIGCFLKKRIDKDSRGNSCANRDINGDGWINGGDMSCVISMFMKSCKK